MFGKEILGGLALVLDVVGYFPYLKSIIRRETQPHMFSWIVWTVTTGIAFFAQVDKGAGPGAWVTGLTTLINVVIVIISVSRGEKGITRTDWISFVLAAIALMVWYFTKNPLGAVILSSLVSVLGSYPTVRKSIINPKGEALSFWIIVTVRSLVALAAIETYSVTTIIYPAVNSLINASVLIALLPAYIRKQQR